jgi:hypothetical protein
MSVCYQASIVDQFEVLSRRWMNREFVPESEAGHDLLVGQNNRPADNNERRCTLHSPAGTATVKAMADSVIPVGGGYFFVPLIATLRRAGQVGGVANAVDR